MTTEQMSPWLGLGVMLASVLLAVGVIVFVTPAEANVTVVEESSEESFIGSVGPADVQSFGGADIRIYFKGQNFDEYYTERVVAETVDGEEVASVPMARGTQSVVVKVSYNEEVHIKAMDHDETVVDEITIIATRDD